MSKHPLLIELFCGLGAVSKVFEEEGWDCLGFDIERHIYGPEHYPCQLVIQDVLTLHGSQFRDADFIWASPSCQEFSYMAMPWKRGKQIAAALHGEANFPEEYTGSRTVKELTALFDACFRIHREAIAATARNCLACGGKGFVIWYVNDCRPCERCGGNGFVTRHIPMVVENVKGAQPWVGQARANFGSFFLWGDIGMANGNIVVSGAGFGDVLPAPGRTGGKANPDGTDHPQGSWFAIADSRQRGVGTKIVGFDRRTDPGKGARFTSRDCGVEKGFAKEWRDSPNGMPMMSSGSPARKAASALIAKIPEPLSRYLARAFNPGRVIARGGIATRGGH